LKKCSTILTKGFEYVFYNANRNFTLQYQLILEAIDPSETREESNKKIKLVSCFLDLYFTKRIFNSKSVDYSSIVYNDFLLFKKLEENLLQTFLISASMKFQVWNDSINEFRLNGRTTRYMIHILSRMTDFIETKSGLTSNFNNYVNRELKIPMILNISFMTTTIGL